MKGKYNLLVIDDDLSNRKEGYEQVLNGEFLELSYIESGSPNELEKIHTSNAHGVLLDVNLDKWTGPSETRDLFFEVAQRIGKRLPVFLISNKWNQDNIRWVNNAHDLVNIRYYFSWDSDVQSWVGRDMKNSYVPVVANIKNALDLSYRRDTRRLEDNESIYIMHISDTQFGDGDFDSEAVLLESLIPRYLNNHKIDLLVLSGDAVYSGKPSEFNMAERWLSTFSREILGSDFRSRLLLVPGNHDVNLLLTAVDHYKYNFGTNRLEQRADTLATRDHHSYGLAPFREFAYRMTGEIDWFTGGNNLCFVNDRFLNWGLRFYNLNSVVDQSYLEPSNVNIPEANLSALLQSPRVDENIYNIAVAHHHPSAFGQKFDSGTEAWYRLRNFIETARVNLFLHGHSHGFNTYNVKGGGTFADKTLYHMTSTLSLAKQLRVSDALRGFSIIEIQRKDGLVDLIQPQVIKNYEIVGAKIRVQQS